MSDDVLRSIDLLYSAALDAVTWDDALMSVARASGGFAATIISISRDGPAQFCTNNIIEANEVYSKSWFDRDVLQKQGKLLAPKNGMANDRSLLSDELRRRDPYINEFWPEYDVRGMSGYSFTLDPEKQFALAIQLGRKGEYFTDSETQKLGILGPHARRALSLWSELHHYRTVAASTNQILDGLATPCLIVDSQCRVKHLNNATLMVLGEGIQVRQSKLTFKDVEKQKQLELFVRVLNSGIKTCNAIPFQNENGERFVATIYPIPQNQPIPMLNEVRASAVAIIMINSRNVDIGIYVDDVLKNLGLTKAEAMVARKIASGQSIEEIANTLSVSVHTVRSQVKSTFSKLGFSRQAEVAAFITRLATFSVPDE